MNQEAEIIKIKQENKRLSQLLAANKERIKILESGAVEQIAEEKPKIYAYIRVSSNKSTNENQRQKIQAYCDKKGIIIDEWVEEVVSGIKSIQSRKLGRLFDKMKQGDHLIVCELSRITRDIRSGILFMQALEDKKVSLYSMRENFTPKDNLQTIILILGHLLSAHVERDMISKRTKAGLALRRAQGVKFGRPQNTTINYALENRKEEILQMLDNGQSVSQIAKHLQVNDNTLRTCLSKNKDFFNYPRRKPSDDIPDLILSKQSEINQMFNNGLNVTQICKQVNVCSRGAFVNFLNNNKKLFPLYGKK